MRPGIWERAEVGPGALPSGATGVGGATATSPRESGGEDGQPAGDLASAFRMF